MEYHDRGHFGELALLSGDRRAATVRAVGAPGCSCLIIRPVLFLSLPAVARVAPGGEVIDSPPCIFPE
jgi:hypothetical protein